MPIILKLLRIHLVKAAFFGDLTIELITAAINQYQAKFEALLADGFSKAHENVQITPKKSPSSSSHSTDQKSNVMMTFS